MKTIFSVWRATKDMFAIIATPVLSFLAFVYVYIRGAERYEEEFALIRIGENSLYEYVYLLFIVIYCLLLVYVTIDTIKNNKLLFYWTNMNKRSIYIFLLLEEQNSIYGFFILNYLFGRKISIHNKMLLLPLLIVATSLLFSDFIATSNIGQFIFKRRNGVRIGNVKLIRSFPMKKTRLQCVAINLKYRYSSLERTIYMILAFLVAGITFFIDATPQMYFCFFLVSIVIFVCAEDNYWKRDSKTMMYIIHSGVKVTNYIRPILFGGVIYYLLFLNILFLIRVENIWFVLAYAFCGLISLLYWMSVYLYFYLYIDTSNTIIKDLFVLIFAILFILPGINIGVAIYFWRKIICWN